MKATAGVLLSLTLVLALTGCGGKKLSIEQASEAYSAAKGYPPDYLHHCESVGKVDTRYGRQPGYVCALTGSDGYVGPVCFIWRDDGQVLYYNRGKCGAPNDPTEGY